MLNRYSERQILNVILLISVLLRLVAAIYLGNTVVELPGTFDQISYHNLALRLIEGHGFSFGEMWWPATHAGEPTAHWSFLYTLFLATIYWVLGNSPLVARVIQAIVVGIAVPWLLYKLVGSLFAERPKQLLNQLPYVPEKNWHGLLAAGIAAIYIYFIYYAAALMTESFYITGILLSLWMAVKISRLESATARQWLLLGIALGLTVLLRQVFLLFIPFLIAWLWWSARPRIGYLISLVAIIFLMILPWSIRNYYAFDQFVLLNTNAGFALYWGNHPIHGTSFEPILSEEKGSYFSLLPEDLLHLNEAQLDSAVLSLAIENIIANPTRFLLLSLSRIRPYFMFWPSADSGLISNLSRVLSFGLFLPFMLMGLIMALFRRGVGIQFSIKSPLTLIYLFMLIYAGIHIATWTLIRYRLPIDAVLIIFAALPLDHLRTMIRPTTQRKLSQTM